jgi:hypothetical protein
MLKQLKAARIVALLIVAVLPFALIACGGDSKKDTYKKDANKIANQVKADSQAAQQSFQAAATSPDKLVTAFNDWKGKLDKSISDFEALNPPDDIKDAHDKFVTNLKALSEDLGTAATALKNQDQAALQQLQTKITTDSTALQTSASYLDNKLND